MSKKIMLLTLETFKSAGGIQNMTKTLAYAIDGLSVEKDWSFKLWSLHDDASDLDDKYLPAQKFKGFSGNYLTFFTKLFGWVKWPNVAIINHINLAIAGLIIKTFNSKCKVWVIAHGIEVWRDLSAIKRALLNKCDKVICVSDYTKQEMMRLHHIPENKCVVLNNALDPFFEIPESFEKPDHLLKRYAVYQNDKVLFTLTRINSAEQYKGYDKVIEAVALIKGKYPTLKYILGGKYDNDEQTRIEQLIAEHQLQANFTLAGFIDDNELTNHFLLADMFVMPSKGEGFGLVLIEATACGTRVICGNDDGSVDAVRNGELGQTIDVDDLSALVDALNQKLNSPLNISQKKALQQDCLKHFNVRNYADQLSQLIQQ